MVFGVLRGTETVGTVEVSESAGTWLFEVDCVGGTADIVRCYGATGGAPLLIGVLEPQDGRLRCTRRVSRQSLRQQCGETPPQRYFLAASTPEPALRTGDRALDRALTLSDVHAEETAYGLRITCPFDCTQPFALACAATACTIEHIHGRNFAVLAFQCPFYRLY